MDEIKLANDKLERGSYAMTLFRIIADYMPKRVYEIAGYKELSDIPDEEENEEPAISLMDHHDMLGQMMSFKPRMSAKASGDEPDDDFEGKLNHLDNGAFIIAISGSWGSGKTTFVDMFSKFLCGEGIESGKNQFITDNCLAKEDIVKFNAWKNDFYDDPLLPLSRLMIQNICSDPNDRKDVQAALSDYVNALRHAMHTENNDPTYAQDNVFYDKDATKTKLRYDISPLDFIMDEENAIETRIKNVQTVLQAAVQRNRDRRKAVVIIDELDRCKPTFAIKLLEIVKHLFNVRGLVFIFALDMIQLQHCIKTVYGAQFDALGYLERFFDYNTYLPQGDRWQLFKSYAKEYDMLKENEEPDDYYDMCMQHDLKAREIKAVCSAFHYLKRYELEEYPELARKLYFYLLLLKYKLPEPIQKLDGSQDKNKVQARRVFFEENLPPFLQDMKDDFLRVMSENKVIGTIHFSYIDKEDKVDEEQRTYRLLPIDVPVNEADLVEKEKNLGSLSYVLFQKDLHSQKTEKMHLLEYLFRKVEMYDTVGFDSKTMLEIEGIRRGSILKMGHWPPHDEEKIEWIVLDIEGSEALLISKHALDFQPYNEDYVDVTWSTCTLRQWLNKEFYENAFDEDERKKILLKTIETPDNEKYRTPGGSPSKDHVFLLSIEEARGYLKTNNDRKCTPTRFAVEQYAKAYKKHMNKELSEEDKKHRVDAPCRWRLRSPGIDPIHAAYVDDAGSLNRAGDYVYYVPVAVRQSLWINLES